MTKREVFTSIGHLVVLQRLACHIIYTYKKLRIYVHKTNLNEHQGKIRVGAKTLLGVGLFIYSVVPIDPPPPPN